MYNDKMTLLLSDFVSDLCPIWGTKHTILRRNPDEKNSLW